MSSDLRVSQHRHLVLTITIKEYAEYMGFEFVPPHNPENYVSTMGNAQDQALRTEKFRQNQALFREYTAMNGALKKQIIMAVEPLFLYPLLDHLT